MAALPERHLHVVDGIFLDDNGEVVPPEVARLHAEIAALKGDRKMLKRDIVTKNRKISELQRNRAAERLNYEGYEKIEKVHSYWNRRLGHELALTADRFDAVRGILEEKKIVAVDGRSRKVDAFEFPADFKRAIDGAWFDPFITKQKNGREKRHDDLALICRDGKTFQSFIDRAPVPKVAPQRPEAFVTDWSR